MAIFYCQTSNMSRGKGHSAVAAAAYRAGEKLIDERRGEVHDYLNKEGVIDAFLINAGGLTRAALWNAAEACEPRKDARVAREWQLALPHELNGVAHRAILEDFSRNLVGRYGVAIDVAIHAPGREGDHRNIHAHLLMSSRAMGSNGQFSGEKTQLNWSDKKLKEHGLPTGKQQLEAVRKVWERIVNTHLKNAGITNRIDHRSLKEQGITDRIPTPHLGKSATAKIRRGKTSIKYDRLDSSRDFNKSMMELEIRKRAIIRNYRGYGRFSPHRDFKRLTYRQPEKLQDWRPAERSGKNILSFFSGWELGVFRWTKGHAQGKVAFINTKKGIESFSTNSWALAAQLQLAQQKVERGEWSSITLSGSDEFKHRARLQAAEMGIKVDGYKEAKSSGPYINLAQHIISQALGRSQPNRTTPVPKPTTKKPSKGMDI